MKFLIYLAVLPSVMIGILIYNSDKKEKEPISELIKALGLGLVSAVLAVVISYILSIIDIPYEEFDSLILLFLYATICIGLVEEGSKWLCTSFLLRKNENYNYLFDGVVYSVFVSLGFATIENILYVLVGGFKAVLLRGVLTVPAHAFFGAFMGYYLSIAKLKKIENDKQGFKQNTFYSILIPTLLHGTFDFLLLAGNEFIVIIFFVFVIYLYISSIKRIKYLSKIERPFEIRRREYCGNCGNRALGNFCSNCGNRIQ